MAALPPHRCPLIGGLGPLGWKPLDTAPAAPPPFLPNPTHSPKSHLWMRDSIRIRWNLASLSLRARSRCLRMDTAFLIRLRGWGEGRGGVTGGVTGEDVAFTTTAFNWAQGGVCPQHAFA
jgi:hypothetical protein